MGGRAVVVTSWCWAAASSRGVSHERAGTRLQDSIASFLIRVPSSEYFVGIVCDGAGSAPFGGQGASLVCRSFSVAARHHFRTHTTLPTREHIDGWIDNARDLLGAVATRRGLALRDFAATLVCVISNGMTSLIAHIGDGCVVLKDDVLNCLVAPTWPFHGEYVSTTAFVTDDEGARLQFVNYANPVSALAAFSDGIERLALDFVTRQPFRPFFESMLRPLLVGNTVGRDRYLSSHLATYLNSSAVNARTDDDKSLILAVRR